MEKNINLLVFAPLVKRPELNSDRLIPKNTYKGEKEIFRLIRYDRLDGMIILGDSMLDIDSVDEIAAEAEKHSVPVIDLSDPYHTLKYNVTLSDKAAMGQIVSHLIEDHGVTKINFIGGFKGNPQTDERLAAYRKELERHGIPYDESRVDYGEFWTKAADCAERFMLSEDKPRAIVCASDSMALFCMDKMKEMGLRIPEDIIVTGFDGLSDCDLYTPTLTSVRRDFRRAGEVCVDLLEDIISGKEAPQMTYVGCELVKNGSCGCGANEPHKIKSFMDSYYERNRLNEFNTYILDTNAAFSGVSISEELFSDAENFAKFFKMKRLYICICANVENVSVDIDRNEGSEFAGFSDKMVSMYQYGHSIPNHTEFPTSDYLPEPFLDGDEPVFMAFSPLYFKNRMLGYIAFEPSCMKGEGKLLATWTMTLSHNAGGFYVNKELEMAVRELENLYVRDPLTGLYNRRGMKRMGNPLIENARRSGSLITVICADIDRLKYINDNFGHEAGDNAIVQAAKAIRYALPSESICTRTGGDEYCVIISHSPDFSVDENIAKISSLLDEYNAASGLPYQVGCSCGYYTVNASEITTVDSMIKTADTNMYRIKQAKKASK